MDHKCDGCGVVIEEHVCCAACKQRIRQMRGEKLPITIKSNDQVLAIVETWEAAIEFAYTIDPNAEFRLIAECNGETFVCQEDRNAWLKFAG